MNRVLLVGGLVVKETGSIELKDEIFGVDVNVALLHEAVKNYLANPVVLWSHDYSIPAIGYAKNIQAESVLEGDIVFNEKEYDEFGWSIGERVKAGALRCGSVGFIAEEIEFLEAKDRECDLIFRKQELLEFSICCVPANPFARNNGSKKLEITEVIQSEELSYFDRLREGLRKTGA